VPTYSYKCEKCDTITDVRMSMSETTPEIELRCEICDEDTHQVKVITASGGFQLKGKGWFGNSKTTKGY
jgi:putative FmdB family regulatory protein